MNKKVADQLQHIDNKLDALLTDLKKYPAEALRRKPTAESWSVVEVLQHLMLVENASQKYVQKKLSYNPTLPKTNLGTAWRMFLLQSYNWLPIKLKAPTYVNESKFTSDIEFSEVAAQWQAQRQQLQAYIATLPHDLFDKEVYKHPLVGRLSLFGMLRFYEGHFDRHYKQIQKILSAANSK